MSTGTGGATIRDVAVELGAATGRTPTQLALIDTLRENVSEATIDGDLIIAANDRWDDDDAPADDATPDLGERHDDEPADDQTHDDERRDDEHAAMLSARPDIFLWLRGGAVHSAIRPTALAVLEDSELSGAAVQREERLAKYAAGLAQDFRGTPHVLTQPLVRIWDDALSHAESQEETALRWNLLTPSGRPDDSGLSRDGAVLVALPRGRVVPLQFFTWKKRNAEVIRLIAEADDLLDPAASAYDIVPRLFPDSKSRKNAYLYFAWVRAAVAQRRIVLAHRALFRSYPARFDQVRNALGAAILAAEGGSDALQKSMNRAEPVLNRALIGGIG